MIIPVIVGAFHVRGDEWVMPLKLSVFERFCDVIVVVLDRPSPELAALVYARAAVQKAHYVIHIHENTLGLADEGADGPICEEGIMRREAWDLATEFHPKWVVLGDADEIPSPEILRYLHDGPKSKGKDIPPGTVVRGDWVHLYKHPQQFVSGSSIWSPSHSGSTKKGFLVRYDPERTYSYAEDKFRHVPPEPVVSPSIRDVYDPDLKLVHWKWVHWERWERSAQSKLQKYQRFWRGMKLEPVPQEWHW